LNKSKSNQELILRIRKGDRIAFYWIYERYCKRLFGFVLRYLKVEADAEEIVQEVFVKIWESRSKLDAYSSFESFLFTIAFNATMNLLRKKANDKKYQEHLKSIQQIQKAPNIINELQFKDLNERLTELLNELSPRQKEIFQLSRENGLSHEEIAEKLGISKNTVKKHMVNSLAFLKANLGTEMIIAVFYICLFL